jgi:hypothetical protein
MADQLELQDTVRQRWRLDLGAERLRFASDEAVIDVVRERIDDALSIVHAAGSKPLLRLKDAEHKKRHHFKLEPEQFAVLGAWVGRKRMTRLSVVGFAWIGIIVGVLWILGSLPMQADLENSIEAVPFSIPGLLLGVLALGAGIMAKLAPMRGVLVADAAWCVGASIDSVWDVLYADSSPVWLIVPIILLGVAYGQLRLFGLLGLLAPKT